MRRTAANSDFPQAMRNAALHHDAIPPATRGAGVCSRMRPHCEETGWAAVLQDTRRLQGKWCGRGDSNPHRHCCPTDFRTSYGFRRLAAPRGEASSWSGLSLHRAPAPEFRCCPSSLYTFPVGPRASALGPVQGLARDCQMKGFPEFGQFCIPGFPREHSQSLSKSVASTGSATPAWRAFYIARNRRRASVHQLGGLSCRNFG